jgi:hypothetical protein
MTRLLRQLFEMPIEDFQTVGDFSGGSSFRHATDRRLISNPAYVQRIKNAFANTPYDFRMWFVNNTESLIGHADKAEPGEGQRREPFLEEGPVTMEWLQQKMPQTLAQIQQQGGLGEDAINIIFTNNSGAERRPMTAWIIAHRAGHAILRTVNAKNYTFSGNLYASLEKMIGRLFEMYKTTIPYYKDQRSHTAYSWNAPQNRNLDAAIVRRLLASLGTFKSARENNLRTAREFIFECFAQYLIQGGVVLNAPQPRIITGYAWGRPQQSWGQVDQNAAASVVQQMADQMNQAFEEVLSMSAGQIFVM